MATTYRRIVDDIRARIRSGQLKPGARVPSARQITREWGVAIATATKALSALAAEGLVRPVVGVGTVVATVDSPQRTMAIAAEVTRAAIVRTAIAVADAEGLPAVTMRRLATGLDVAVMSLYRHVAGKDEVVLLMADAVFAEVAVDDLPRGDWRAGLEAIARAQWELSRRHPWLPSVMSLSRPMIAPHGMALTEWSMRTVHSTGLDLMTSLRVSVALAGFVLGIASSVQLEVEAQRETGLTSDEWMESRDSEFGTIIASGRFPMLAALGTIPEFKLDLDSLFEAGLRLFLDGLAQLVATPSADGLM